MRLLTCASLVAVGLLLTAAPPASAQGVVGATYYYPAPSYTTYYYVPTVSYINPGGPPRVYGPGDLSTYNPAYRIPNSGFYSPYRTDYSSFYSPYYRNWRWGR